MTFDAPAAPAGYQVLRCLSERSGSWVFLARNPRSELCCLKLQRSPHPGTLARLVRIRVALQELAGPDLVAARTGRAHSSPGTSPAPATRDPQRLGPGQDENRPPSNGRDDHADRPTGSPSEPDEEKPSGLIPLTAWGQEAAEGILWEEMPLADDLVTEAPPGEAVLETYTPFTLLARIQERRTVTTSEVLEGALPLARAIEALHARGLFHRDIKPSNILRFRGQWVLADYGSVGEAGAEIHFPGTEGYVPPDGLGSPALDVFALGRTLYEWWTGHGTFRFPGLPAACLRADDWRLRGWLLNEAIVRAGDGRPSHRYPTMRAFREALETARAGRRRVSRRTWMLSGTAAATVIGAAWIVSRRPPYRAVWKRNPLPRFAYESWSAEGQMCDWPTRWVYSAKTEASGLVVQRHHLDTHRHEVWRLANEEYGNLRPFLDRPGKQLLIPTGVTGRVRRVGFDGTELPAWENLDPPDLQRVGVSYWNPVSDRLGQFAGYGNWACHNRRSEFDPVARQWIPVKEDGTDLPWPRRGHWLFPEGAGHRWYLYGGEGSPTGREYEPAPLKKNPADRYYDLGDLWELDLDTGRWRNLIPVQGWRRPLFLDGLHHPGIGANLLVEGANPKGPGETTFHLAWPEPGRTPTPLPNAGDYANVFWDIHRMWSCLLDPESHEVWLLSEQGVFTVTLDKI